MLRLLAFLWSGCPHKWEIHKTYTLYSDGGAELPIGVQYHLRCTKCGNMKKKQMYT